MRKISELTTAVCLSPSGPWQKSVDSSTPSDDARKRSAIVRLWTRMRQMYGHRWQSAMGDCVDPQGGLTDTAQLWLGGLADVSLPQIANGVNGLLEGGPDWPPTLPEFRRMCAGQSELSPRERHAAAERRYQESRRALPAPGGTWAEQRELGAQHSGELLAMLRGRREVAR